MSMKAILVTAAGVLIVTPAFALSNKEIVHHSGGPIPYSQFMSSPSASSTGYNTRAQRRGKKAPATGDSAVAADVTAIAASPDVSATPAPVAPAPAAPGAETGVNPPAAGPPSSPDVAPPAAAPQ